MYDPTDHAGDGTTGHVAFGDAGTIDGGSTTDMSDDDK